MASGEENDKGKDLFEPKDPNKISDKNGKATSPSNATGKKSKSEENPFSFKKFLQASEGQNGVKGTCMKVLNPDLAKDLPDFVQGHTSHAESGRSQNNLPDFTFCTSGKEASNNLPPIQSNTMPPAHPIQPPLNDDANNLSLPDFLSGSLGIPLLKNDSIDENEHNLHLQNSLLWQKIEQLNAAFVAEKQRNEALSSQLSELTDVKEQLSLHQPSLHQPTPSTSKPSPQQNASHPESEQDNTEGCSERGCGRCVVMADHIRSASEQLNTIVQAANQFSRVLSEGSENLSNISRILTSASSLPSPPHPDQQTVQHDN